MSLSPAALTEALSQYGVLPVGRVDAITILEKFDAAYADTVVKMRLTYSHETPSIAPKTLIYKELGPKWYETVGLPELRFFNELAPQTQSKLVPDFYGALSDPEAQICALLLEDLSQDYELASTPIDEARLAAIVTELARWHAFWWDHPQMHEADLQTPAGMGDVTRMPHALSSLGLEENEQIARVALKAFAEYQAPELTPKETTLLQRLEKRWGVVFGRRLQDMKHLTLLHGDFHLLGNVLFARVGSVSLKVIDWAQAKPGLGPHDLMYALLSVPDPDRVARDTALLKRYHAELGAQGVEGYNWTQCLWDYRFSLLTNLWQAVLQNSLRWFRKTAELVEVWESDGLLD